MAMEIVAGNTKAESWAGSVPWSDVDHCLGWHHTRMALVYKVTAFRNSTVNRQRQGLGELEGHEGHI